MEYKKTDSGIAVMAQDFSLRDTLDCGQCFRWYEQDDGTFAGVHRGVFLRVGQKGRETVFYDTPEDVFLQVWCEYFDFDTDYGVFKAQYDGFDVLKRAREYAGGIRLVRQDPWEAVCGFIISQNNNIPRIKGIMHRLCEGFGEQVADGYYAIPAPEILAGLSPEDLSGIRAGFRAKYLVDAARKFVSGQVDPDRVRNGGLAEGEAQLRQILGVGPKVAQCILLYGFHRLDAFPVDTWIKKALSRYFPDGFPEQLRDHAGVAQQYLFHYIRHLDRK